MFEELNKKVWCAVGAAHRAGLQHLGRELYQVGPVTSPAQLRILVDRWQTVKTLLRLRPPSAASLRKCMTEFDALGVEIVIAQMAVKEQS